MDFILNLWNNYFNNIRATSISVLFVFVLRFLLLVFMFEVLRNYASDRKRRYIQIISLLLFIGVLILLIKHP